jgi:hypothetical protein
VDESIYYSEDPQYANVNNNLDPSLPPPPPPEPEEEMIEMEEEEEPEGPPNLFNNLWNIAQSSLNDISAHHRERAENGDPNDVSPAVDLLLSTAGSVGNEVAEYDPTKTRNKDTLGAVTGFFNNLGGASLDTIGKTAERTFANVTSDTWFQEKVSDGVSYVFGVPQDTAQQIDLVQGGDSDSDLAAGDDSSSSFLDDGICEVEWNANYMGDLLNNGHETIVGSEGECCDYCEMVDGCNAWVYCGYLEGCGTPYYKQGECYLKYQKHPQNKKAYERGISDQTGGYVLWTSGIVKSKTYGEGVVQKSYSSDPPSVEKREVIHVSDIPGTWYFNGIPHVSPGYDPTDRAQVMKANPVQCGDYNLLPGVASYNKDYNMRLQTPAVTPGGMVLLLWSNSPGNTVLPSGYMGSPCGPLDLQIHAGSGGLMWDQQISKANSDGSATFVLDGVNVANGNKCTTFLYQYVDIATCKVSLVLDTRFGL